MGQAILLIPVVAAVLAAKAWALMLLVGVIHHEVVSAVAPVGFGVALVMSLLLASVLWGMD